MKTTNSEKMNQKWYSLGCIIPCVAGISLCASSLSAQDESEEIFELSPFTVSADDADGYRATSTMAGTRLKTDLKDLGSSISVITKEMFADTGATDASTMLSYTAGTEVSGVNGNFAGGLGGNHNGRPTQEIQRLDPAQSQRVRGLASASLTRNLFLTDIPFEDYNTSRVEISRGANSILFGIGSPGGVINASTVLAHPDGEDFTEVSVRIGERGSHRETVDLHSVVVDGRLAVRLNLLNKDTQYKQDPAYEEDQRMYLTAQAVLSKNEERENIGPLRARLSYEKGSINGTPPNIIPPGDGFSSWWALPDASLLASVPGVQIPFYHPDAGTVDPSVVGPYDDRRIHPEFGIDGWESQATYDTRLGIAPRKQLPNFAEAWGNWDSSIVFAEPSGDATPVVWGNGSKSGDFEIGSGIRQFATMNFYGGNRNGQLIPNFTNPVIMDKGVWDNTRSMIQGSTNFTEQDFEANNITLEQTFFNDKFGIELAYDQQNYNRFGMLPFSYGETNGDNGESDITIDISEYLVTGCLLYTSDAADE